MKISTSYILSQIPAWLGRQQTLDALDYVYFRGNESQDKIDESCSELNIKGPSTVSSFRTKIRSLFTSGKEWKRDTKCKLGDEWENFFYAPQGEKVKWSDDFAQDCDDVLVQQYGTNSSLAERCILRNFYPRNESLSENFRLQVITTPDDSQIIGWIVGCD